MSLSACAPSDYLTKSEVSDKVETCQDIGRSALVLIDKNGYYREVICQTSYSTKQN